MRISPIFAWYDLWVGVFVDRTKRRVYIFPLPCFGIVIEWAERANTDGQSPDARPTEPQTIGPDKVTL